MSASFINAVDERTKLAGNNKLEVLLFSLGTDPITERSEVFGINVFKVREVLHAPEITRAPDMPDSVEGMVSLRGSVTPVINLSKFCGILQPEPSNILVIAEYNKNVIGFLVHSVDTIQRLDWDKVKMPPGVIANRMGGLVTAVTELEDGPLVMILDVEKVLAEVADLYDTVETFDGVEVVANPGKYTVLFADDSKVARNQVASTLEKMGVKGLSAINGQQAWERLMQFADMAEQHGTDIKEYIDCIITDVEMPEMDGYVFTRKIKEDNRTAHVPVIMHSSLSADANQLLGKSVGVDSYVPKFQPAELSHTLREIPGTDGPRLEH